MLRHNLRLIRNQLVGWRLSMSACIGPVRRSWRGRDGRGKFSPTPLTHRVHQRVTLTDRIHHLITSSVPESQPPPTSSNNLEHLSQDCETPSFFGGCFSLTWFDNHPETSRSLSGSSFVTKSSGKHQRHLRSLAQHCCS
ncbi:hypothetical protein GE21DRAFT_1342383 [Neurospora crassa]|nr:related to pullulanase operon protein pulb [imported] - Neurospora crassa [Neurospora crassa]KHE80056.1 hypothetical protein GE21DRAFT_1342383 [Neurospora crassa]